MRFIFDKWCSLSLESYISSCKTMAMQIYVFSSFWLLSLLQHILTILFYVILYSKMFPFQSFKEVKNAIHWNDMDTCIFECQGRKQLPIGMSNSHIIRQNIKTYYFANILAAKTMFSANLYIFFPSFSKTLVSFSTNINLLYLLFHQNVPISKS